MSETEGMAYERLREAVRALGGSLEHTKPDQPRGGTWVLQLGRRTLEMPSTQSMRYPDLDACYRLKPDVAVSRTWQDHTNEIEPLGLAKLFGRLAQDGR